MYRRVFVASLLGLGARFSAGSITREIQSVIEPDVTAALQGKGWRVYNRQLSLITDAGKKAIRFNDGPGMGIAMLEDFQFTNGVIEFDVRGQNVPQKSFVGVAFHAIDETTCDAVYFRPFNFKTDDPVRHGHAVQYISPPVFTWEKLRKEQPGKYEQPVQPVPDPDAWFHARVVVDGQKIRVFVNDATQPCLAIEKLNDRKSGLIGLWVGDGSGGDFANLKMTRR